jgi:hypothetical protein
VDIFTAQFCIYLRLEDGERGSYHDVPAWIWGLAASFLQRAISLRRHDYIALVILIISYNITDHQGQSDHGPASCGLRALLRP